MAFLNFNEKWDATSELIWQPSWIDTTTGIAALTAVPTLSGSAFINEGQQGPGDVVAAPDLDGTAFLQHFSLGGDGDTLFPVVTLAGAARIDRYGTAALAAIGLLTGAGTQSYLADGTLTAAPTLAGTGTKGAPEEPADWEGVGLLVPSPTLGADGFIAGHEEGAGSVIALPQLSGVGFSTLSLIAEGMLTPTITISGGGHTNVSRQASGVLSPAPTIAGDGDVNPAAPILLPEVTITGQGTIQHFGTGTLLIRSKIRTPPLGFVSVPVIARSGRFFGRRPFMVN